jgi:hypothetical protein
MILVFNGWRLRNRRGDLRVRIAGRYREPWR